MKQICEFDPIRDVQAVEQSGYIDLAKANATSSIPSGISNTELNFNEIDDPRAIGGRPADTFEALQMMRSTADYTAPSDDKKE